MSQNVSTSHVGHVAQARLATTAGPTQPALVRISNGSFLNKDVEFYRKRLGVNLDTLAASQRRVGNFVHYGRHNFNLSSSPGSLLGFDGMQRAPYSFVPLELTKIGIRASTHVPHFGIQSWYHLQATLTTLLKSNFLPQEAGTGEIRPVD